MTDWMGNVDWIQAAGFMITVVLFVGLVFGGWAYYNSERAKVHVAESDDLVKTRGQKIDDLQEEITELNAKLDNQQGQIDMLRKLKTEEIIDGVIKGLKKRGVGDEPS
jgi:hypothetical protein